MSYDDIFNKLLGKSNKDKTPRNEEVVGREAYKITISLSPGAIKRIFAFTTEQLEEQNMVGVYVHPKKLFLETFGWRLSNRHQRPSVANERITGNEPWAYFEYTLPCGTQLLRQRDSAFHIEWDFRAKGVDRLA